MNFDERNPIVIAHRGASGYVPEHTLVSKGIAHAMGADYLEQDIVGTLDGKAVVLHDITVDTVTDVAQKFPDRKRRDGRYYAIDFTLAELQSLNVRERFDYRTGRPVYPGRYPGSDEGFRINSLEEELRFIQGLNRTMGREAGIYPEIKHPQWHRGQGCDLTAIVLETLERFGYRRKSDLCYLQCFDEFEVRRIREELGYQGRLIQLINRGHDAVSGTDFSRLRTAEGLSDLAERVDGIGPRVDAIVSWDADSGLVLSDLVKLAKERGLEIHPWTVRADDLPTGCDSIGTLVRALLKAGVDGCFSDHPDQVLGILARGGK